MESRALQLIAVAAIVASLIGFFAGTRNPGGSAPAAAQAPTASVPRAPSYRDLRARGYGPNAGMYDGQVGALVPEADLFAVVVQTDADRAEALRVRAERRAYDGAPPVIPHAVDQRAFPDCLSCHENGARVAGKVAPRMSHERHDSCTQCHVVSATPLPNGRDESPENSFQGLASAPRGERAWAGAPPTIPHSTAMRAECMSCHGSTGRLGLRTPHPWRQSCAQCHTPSAALDRAPGSEAPSPIGAMP